MTAAVTLPPENAALVVAGVQTIVTLRKPWPEWAGDRVVIHAGTRLPTHGTFIGDYLIDANHVEGTVIRGRPDRTGWLPVVEHLHPGHIVGSAVVRDVVPIVWWHDERIDPAHPRHVPSSVAVSHLGDNLAHLVGDGLSGYVTDQLPFADFTPGRWAVLLDDVTPTTDRCPACWGTWAPCRVCFTPNGYVGGAGTCPPIPWRGGPGVWEWTP